MNEKELLEKQNELLNSLNSLKGSFRNSLQLFITVYAILLLFVIGYTSYVYFQISHLATPASVAQLIVNTVHGQLPVFRQNLRKQMTPMASRVAEASLDAAADMIPNMGQYARNLIAAKADEIVDDFKAEHFPVIEKNIDEAIAAVIADKAKIKDRTLGDELSVVIVDSVNREMDKIINKDFYASVNDLQQTLDTLRSKPVQKMTRKEYSEFTFILCWVRLNELSRSSDEDTGLIGSLAVIAEQASSAFSNVIGEKPAAAK